MAMVGLEKWFMASPLKKLMQRNFEFRFFEQLLKSHRLTLDNKAILEVGCGSGYGLKLLNNRFSPNQLVGIDIDRAQLQHAQKTCPQARIYLGDVTDLSEPSNTFDGAFAFTVFHHVPKWRKGLREIYRVLKPRGVLLVNELDKGTLDWLERVLKIHHPPESRFTWEDFSKGLQKTGFKILQQSKILGAMGFFCCQKV
jgi:ubiquinone/menaquinone biosynthesis C-methylase UbiE